MPDVFEEESKKAENKGASVNAFVKLQNLMNDSTFLKNVRTVIIMIIVFGVPMLYFGFFDNLTWDVLLSFKLGGLAILSTVLVTMVRFDTKARAFDDELFNNPDLIKVENEINDETNKITDHVRGIKFVETYNETQQLLANQHATDVRRNELKRQIAVLEVANKMGKKKYSKLVKALHDLELKGAKGKYSPIAYDELVSAESKKIKRNLSAREKITYNPKSENVFAALGNTLFKSLGIGGAGSIPFMIGSEPKTIVIFYLALIVAVISTIIQTYLKVRLKTGKKYLKARQFKRALLQECNSYIANTVLKAQEEKKKAEAIVTAWIEAEAYDKQFNAARDKKKADAEAKVKIESATTLSNAMMKQAEKDAQVKVQPIQTVMI
jgi:hypothetical protein